MKKVILATIATVMFYNQVGYAETITWDDMGSRITITDDSSNSTSRAVNSNQNFELNAETPGKIQEIIAIEALDIPFSEKNKVISEKLAELSDDELSSVLLAAKERNEEINRELDKSEQRGTMNTVKVIRGALLGLTTVSGLIMLADTKTALFTQFSSAAQFDIQEAQGRMLGFGSLFLVAGGLTVMLTGAIEKSESKILSEEEQKELKSEIANLRVLSSQVSAQLTAKITELHAKKLAQ